MCIEDLAIGRGLYYRATGLSAGVPVQLKQDVDRIGIRVSCQAVANGFAGISSSSSDASNRICIVSGQVLSTANGVALGTIDVSLKYPEDAALIQDSLWCVSHITIGRVIETVMMPWLSKRVRAKLDELMRGV